MFVLIWFDLCVISPVTCYLYGETNNALYIWIQRPTVQTLVSLPSGQQKVKTGKLNK